MSNIDERTLAALEEHTQRLDITLQRLSHLIYQSILMAKSLIQEEGHTVNGTTCTVSTNTNNTEIITNIQANIDSSAGGTFSLQVGRFIIQGITVPSDGIWDIDNLFLLARPNDLRQIIVTPASGTPKFINFYLQGRSIGEFGNL